MDSAERHPAPVVLAVVLGLLALAELASRLTAGSTVRAGLAAPVTRHAPGAAVDVELHYAGDVLWLRIRDNGPGSPARYRAGHGLLGMRERAAAAGGSLRTGEARGGGFCVEAELPAKALDAIGALQ